MYYFSDMEERLSHVPRWGIVRTIQRQSVAEHSFRVALIAPRIAEKWWGGGEAFLFNVMRYAILHDQYEAMSGDIPSPAKQFFMEADHNRFRRNKVMELPYIHEDITAIVKIADLFETAVFLMVDQSLGNQTLDSILADVLYCLSRACEDKPGLYAELAGEITLHNKLKQDPLR